eukprot:CAMPEP_0118885884 /NCGR_PEP_ID=MMETSP1163-20130328/24171_1 /TAXON_ID=124430 /ORGANISM="Phaeomonas parva, Strain CCMP2877" /LENGTH=180 /DNA_ID=CAMNT_0006823963 /DNA_START=267 /DNA_END=806 /DNA_ORIENTATION=-
MADEATVERKLLSAFQRSFERLQQLPPPPAVAAQGQAPELLHCSRACRNGIDEAIDGLTAINEERPDAASETTLELLRIASAMWHACEIFLVASTPFPAPDVISWLTTHVTPTVAVEPDAMNEALLVFAQETAPQQRAAQMSDSDEPVAYWDLATRLALHGQLRLLCEMLSQHSEVRRAL